ncbi:MAG: hypothetical protein JST22_04995 [Bacteroidetes bacterium]|nr:hypothetical protein [Bacteroidota bacterium]
MNRILMLLAWVVLLVPVLNAQTPPQQPSPPLYRGFRFDSTFYMGAHSLRHASVARDCRFTFVQTYGGPAGLDFYRDPGKWHTYPVDRWVDSTNARFYDSMAALNVKLIYAPFDLRNIQGSAWGSLSWYGFNPDSNHVNDFSDVIRSGPVDPTGTVKYDSVFNHHVWGVTVQASTSPRDTLIAGSPRYTRGEPVKGTVDSYLWGAMRATDASSFADSTDWYDIVLRMSVPDSVLAPSIKYPPSMVFAYAVLSIRDTAGQHVPGSCLCSFYRVLDTLKITKEMYLDNDHRFGTIIDSATGFRDVTFPFRRPYGYFRVASRTVRIPVGPGDTVTVLQAGDTVRSARLNDSMAIPDGVSRNDGTRCGTYCRRLFDSLKSAGVLSDSTMHRLSSVEGSDLIYDVYTTRCAPVTFQNGTVCSHLYTALRHGYLDHLIDSVVNATLSDVALDTLLMRMGITDEAWQTRYYAFRAVCSKAQRAMLHRNDSLGRPMDTRGIWANPIDVPWGYRVESGDLDSTEIRMIHMQSTQQYHFGGPIPMSYVPTTLTHRDASGKILDNDTTRSMDSLSLYSFYGMAMHDDTMYVDSIDGCGRKVWGARQKFDTVADRYIMGNNPTDYRYYTRTSQTSLRDMRMQIQKALDVSYFRYAYMNKPAYPVWVTAQVQGWLGNGAFGQHIFGNRWRPTTPEEITAQCWLILQSGGDGIVFGDFDYDGSEFGVVHDRDQTRRSEYDTVSAYHPAFTGPQYVLPRQWLGFTTRYNAVKRVTNHFADTILPLYTKFDRRNLRHMHPGDMARGCPCPSTAPRLVDSVVTELADRHDTATKPFKPTGIYDAPTETFLDITEFDPGPNLPADRATNATYLMVSNTRCWPIDHRHYADSSLRIFDTVARYAPAVLGNGRRSDTIGLGNIDVRRPILIFKNGTGVIADSARVQRIGDTATRTVAYGVPVPLDWITPGWGHLYKVTPVARLVSEHGTAWNNAVHAENFSSDSVQRERIICYERDSVIYLRALDTAGVISHEWMISDAADTVTTIGSGGRRTRRASNMRPAVAVIRNEAARTGDTRDGLKCMVAWERRDSIGRASVELFVMDSVPGRTSGLTHARTRKRLTGPTALLRPWMQLAPSIVGVDSGWVVAWGATSDPGGVQLVAVRAALDTTTALNAEDTSGIVRAKMPRSLVATNLWWPADSVCQFPSLAYHRNWSRVFTNGGIFSYQSSGDTVPPAGMPLDTIGGGVNVYGSFHAVRLAYQQGMRNNTSWRIMYHTIGVAFPLHHDYLPGKPQLWLSHAEHVSNGIEGCEDLHPSIAVDSSRTTVAFETVQGTNTITLRQRDTVHLDATAQPVAWATPVYRWGDLTLARPVGSILNLHAYANPSVAQFPGLRTTQLAGVPEGVLVWQWTNAPNTRRNALRLYRFGEKGPDTSLSDAADPTMMLAPNLSASRSTAFATSGILQRGSLAERVTAARPTGDSAFYYPASVVNTQLNPSKVFTHPQSFGTQIVGYFTIAGLARQFSSCQVPAGAVRVGLFLPNVPMVKRRSDSTPVPSPPPAWTNIGLPPAFFADRPGAITSANDAAQVTRTGAFTAGDSAVTLRRVIYGDDSLVAWLNTQPFDTGAGAPANIYVNAQLVRASDGAVLWMGAIVNARTLGHDTLDESISVPVNIYAPRDTVVYIRVLAALSPGIQYETGAGFAFVEQTAEGAIALKGVQRESPAVPGGPTAIGAAMIPNPVHAGEGTLHVLVQEPGAAMITVYDLLGVSVKTLPDLVVERPGEYTVPVGLGDLRNGLYVVEVRMGPTRGTTRFTLMR